MPQVAAACLYLVCRQDSKPFLLIDFSDVLQVGQTVVGQPVVGQPVGQLRGYCVPGCSGVHLIVQHAGALCCDANPPSTAMVGLPCSGPHPRLLTLHAAPTPVPGQINVFTLGAVFLQLAKLLRVTEHPMFAK